MTPPISKEEKRRQDTTTKTVDGRCSLVSSFVFFGGTTADFAAASLLLSPCLRQYCDYLHRTHSCYSFVFVASRKESEARMEAMTSWKSRSRTIRHRMYHSRPRKRIPRDEHSSVTVMIVPCCQSSKSQPSTIHFLVGFVVLLLRCLSCFVNPSSFVSNLQPPNRSVTGGEGKNPFPPCNFAPDFVIILQLLVSPTCVTILLKFRTLTL